MALMSCLLQPDGHVLTALKDIEVRERRHILPGTELF